jgi:hypothetical protein
MVVMPRLFAQPEPDIGLFFALFFNNLLYLASLVLLVVLLAQPSAGRAERLG